MLTTLQKLMATNLVFDNTMLNYKTPLGNPQCYALALVHCVFSEQLETAGAAPTHPDSFNFSRGHILSLINGNEIELK